MNKKQKWLVLVSLLFIVCCTMAQTVSNMPPDPGTVPQPTPEAVKSFFQLIKPVEFLVVPAVTLLITLLRRWIPVIPNGLWPYLSPFIGASIDWAAINLGLWSGNPAAGMLLGGLATWFHQLDKQGPDVLSKLAEPKIKENGDT